MKVNKKMYKRLLIVGLVATTMNIIACSSPNKISSDGNIVSSLIQRTLNQRLQDESIENTAKTNLEYLNRELSNTTRIEINAFDSEVLLTGEVPSAEVKLAVQELISSMPEVKAIYNELKISRQHTLSYKVHDSYINSKLAQKIVRSKDISAGQIELNTETGMIYVMGRVTEQQQHHLIELANKTPGVLELILLTKVIPSIPSSNEFNNTLASPQEHTNSQISQYNVYNPNQ